MFEANSRTEGPTRSQQCISLGATHRENVNGSARMKYETLLLSPCLIEEALHVGFGESNTDKALP